MTLDLINAMVILFRVLSSTFSTFLLYLFGFGESYEDLRLVNWIGFGAQHWFWEPSTVRGGIRSKLPIVANVANVTCPIVIIRYKFGAKLRSKNVFTLKKRN